jgi:hypothetical protein
MAGNSSEAPRQDQGSQYWLDVERERLTAAWWRLLSAVRSSSPKEELYRFRREYLAVRAGLQRYAAHEVTLVLARCMREDLTRRGLSTWASGRYREWDPTRDGRYNADADYYAREHHHAKEAEQLVESSMLPSERADGRLDQGMEIVAAMLGGLFVVAGQFFLLWGFISLIKTLWYLS